MNIRDPIDLPRGEGGHQLSVLEVTRTNETYREEAIENKQEKHEEHIRAVMDNCHVYDFQVFASGFRIPILKRQWSLFTIFGIPKDRHQTIHKTLFLKGVEWFHQNIAAYRRLCEDKEKRETEQFQKLLEWASDPSTVIADPNTNARSPRRAAGTRTRR